MSTRFTRAIVVALALAPALTWSAPALAQDECSEAFSHDAWRAEMDAIDASLEALNIDDAKLKVDGTWRRIGCLDAIAMPGHLARFARQRALIYFFDQDEDNAIRWGLLQREAAPDFPWPESMAEDHPFRSMIMDAEQPPIGGPEGAGLLVEKKSAVFIDGKPLVEPKARAEVPHVMQVVDKKGNVTNTYWQDGAAFPTDLILAGGPKLEAPEDYVVPGPSTYASAGGKLPFGGAVAAVEPEKEPEAVAVKDPEPEKEPEAVAVKDPEPEKEPEAVKDPKPEKEPEVVAVKEPKPDKEPKPEKEPKPDKPPREGGGVGIVNLAASGGLAVAAGTLYFLGGQAGSSLGEQANEADMAAVRSRANAMVIASSVAGVAAVGVGVTAFVSDQGTGVALNWRW